MNKLAKPPVEKINPAFGNSFHVKQYDKAKHNKLPFWHVHPEIELVYVNGGQGKKHIGNHISYFDKGALLLIGSQLPHFGFTDRLSNCKKETIVQLRPDFLGTNFFDLPEMEPIHLLLERSKKGISFFGKTQMKIGPMVEDLQYLTSFERIVHLLKIFNELATSEEYEVLNAEGILLEVSAQDNDRMNKIYGYVRTHFQDTIRLPEIADLVSMTEPSFCRYFKKITGKTFSNFVNDFRIVHATKLLSEHNESITEISFLSGFNNFSHFNKSFKAFTGKSPSQYRKEKKHLL